MSLMPDPDELARQQESTWSSIPGAPPPLPPDDPAQILLQDDYYSVPREGVYSENCFICCDPEFALMGLPLCRSCPECQRVSSGSRQGHIAADGTVCSICGYDEQDGYEVHVHSRHYLSSTRVLWRVVFLQDDTFGAWSIGHIGIDLGQESSDDYAPNHRLIKLLGTDEVLSLDSPYERGTISRLPLRFF